MIFVHTFCLLLSDCHLLSLLLQSVSSVWNGFSFAFFFFLSISTLSLHVFLLYTIVQSSEGTIKSVKYYQYSPAGQDPQPVNCITTFEGVYQFTYEVSWGGGGICDNQDSQIKACQDPGSAYVDNEVFYMTYSRCPEVQTSYSQSE